MTKKDYTRLAGALRFARPTDPESSAYEQWLNNVVALGNVLYDENHSFNSLTFYEACGVNSV